MLSAIALTSCKTGVEKKVQTTSADGETLPDIDFETVPPTTESPYVFVTEADGNLVTVVQDGEVLYVQMHREDAEKLAQGEVVATEVVTAANNSVGQDDAKKIVENYLNILNSKAFSIKGKMISEGDIMPLDFKVFNSNVCMGTQMEGLEILVAVIDEKTYLLAPGSKEYFELTNTVKKLMGMDDLDLTVDFTSDVSTDNIVTNTEMLDGKVVDVYTCNDESNPNNGTKFYLDKGELIKMCMFEGSTIVSEIEIEKLQGNLTANDVNIPSDYKEVSHLTFIGNLMKQMTP